MISVKDDKFNHRIMIDKFFGKAKGSSCQSSYSGSKPCIYAFNCFGKSFPRFVLWLRQHLCECFPIVRNKSISKCLSFAEGFRKILSAYVFIQCSTVGLLTPQTATTSLIPLPLQSIFNTNSLFLCTRLVMIRELKLLAALFT